MIVPLSQAQRHALELIAGCEHGITLDSAKLNGISQRTIDSLIARGRIRTRIASMAKPAGLEVTWLHLAK